MDHFFTQNLEPVYFWPYTSGVPSSQRILEMSFSGGDRVCRFRDELINWFNSEGIKAQPDNKIVFEFLDNLTGKPFYIGFYDLKMSMGYSVWADDSHHRLRELERAKKEAFIKTVDAAIDAVKPDHDWQPTEHWFACSLCGVNCPAPHAAAPEAPPCTGKP